MQDAEHPLEEEPGTGADRTAETVDHLLKLRAHRVLHSCDVVLRLCTRDLNRYAREVQPDQHQMMRLMRIISEINHMAVDSMDELRVLESREDERREKRGAN